MKTQCVPQKDNSVKALLCQMDRGGGLREWDVTEKTALYPPKPLPGNFLAPPTKFLDQSCSFIKIRLPH